MELAFFLKVLWRRWWLVAIPAVIVGLWVLPSFLQRGVAVSGGYTTTFRYTAGQQRDAFPNVDGDLQDVWEASYKLIESITAWARTNSFREEVAIQAQQHGLTIVPDSLQIFPDNERAIGQITLTWADSDELERITQAVITVLQTRNADYFAPQLGGEVAQVILLDAPTIHAAPPSLPSRLTPLIRLGLGILGGIALAFLMEYLDTSIRERNDLQRLGIKTLASIPRR
jgi:capsular polysaccharide biosynthesis protein